MKLRQINDDSKPYFLLDNFCSENYNKLPLSKLKFISLKDIVGMTKDTKYYSDDFSLNFHIGYEFERKWKKVSSSIDDWLLPNTNDLEKNKGFITLIKYGTLYYVSDGKKRVSVAKQNEEKGIYARVKEILLN